MDICGEGHWQHTFRSFTVSNPSICHSVESITSVVLIRGLLCLGSYIGTSFQGSGIVVQEHYCFDTWYFSCIMASCLFWNWSLLNPGSLYDFIRVHTRYIWETWAHAAILTRIPLYGSQKIIKWSWHTVSKFLIFGVKTAYLILWCMHSGFLITGTFYDWKQLLGRLTPYVKMART